MHEEVNSSTPESTVEQLVAETAPAEQAAENVAALADFERRIRDLESAIGDLRTVNAAAAPASAGRRTQGAHGSRMLGKTGEAAPAGSIDAALSSLSVEQRLAVKAGLMRAGVL